jgi:predicted esterase
MAIRVMKVGKPVSMAMVAGAMALGFAITGDASGADLNGAKLKETPSIVPAALTPGQTVTFTAQGETKTTYHVYTPSACQTNAPMLVLFSPGGDGTGMVAAFRESADQAGWIVVGCDKLSNELEGKPEERTVEKELMDDIIARIPHAPNRLYLGGFSGGAERAYLLAARRSETITGIIAMGGWLGGQGNYKLPFCKHMAVAIVNGTEDKNANSWSAADTKVLKERQCTVKEFPFAGKHAMPGPETIGAVLGWLNSAAEGRRAGDRPTQRGPVKR